MRAVLLLIIMNL